MLVSVALPVYNGLPYLKAAIETILVQDVEFELIISDDGSNDGSVELIRSQSDPRIRILTSETNLGIFGNLNRCIAVARGEFVQVFSQDDLMQPGYLASQVQTLRKNPDAGLVYGMPVYIDEKGASKPSMIRDNTPEVIDRDLYLWIASHYTTLPASISSIMIPMRTFQIVGHFNPDYRVAGDVEFYNRVSERFSIARNAAELHAVRGHRRMTSALATSGPLYLREELILDRWYRSRWSASDYRKIIRFRSESRGRFHLGWIRRMALAGRIRDAFVALWRLRKIYPLHWVIWWRIVGFIRPSWHPRPTLVPPNVRSGNGA
jgi:glycosyltransferase involved in cell wall biosynthesis